MCMSPNPVSFIRDGKFTNNTYIVFKPVISGKHVKRSVPVVPKVQHITSS